VHLLFSDFFEDCDSGLGVNEFAGVHAVEEFLDSV
jgi:hypothetical protein